MSSSSLKKKKFFASSLSDGGAIRDYESATVPKWDALFWRHLSGLFAIMK